MRVAVYKDFRIDVYLSVVSALESRGHTADIRKPAADSVRGVDAGVIWNGRHGSRGDVHRLFAEARKPCYIMEHGFFDRMNYTQIDAAGFNHSALWAGCLDEPAPAEGASRFRAVWGCDPAPTVDRDGYVLVLTQLHGDSQLADSETRHPGKLVRAVEAALPDGVDLRVRAHPRADWQCGSRGRAKMLAGTLKDAVAGARFCVTINSNSGNEALAWGCPVLCLGPALYAMAGVAKCSKLADLASACQEMLDGWHPDRAKLTNYLHWLACRQWTDDEIADGWPLEMVMGLET